MVVVRYAALVALVLWLGVMESAVFFDRPNHTPWVEFALGGSIVVGLFAMKFLGPPPHAFVTRVALVILMLCVAVIGLWTRSSRAPVLINMTLGFILLSWYARE
jgi:hypothetical protein